MPDQSNVTIQSRETIEQMVAVTMDVDGNQCKRVRERVEVD